MPECLCPRCGAYWQCGCVLDEWRQPVDQACAHDWVATVGVDRDEGLPDDVNIFVCRLCGIYAAGAAAP